MVFRADPCGITCILMTYACVLYADYVVVRWIILATQMHNIALSWYTPCPECPKDIHIKQTRILHSVILCLESALFGMFVVAIGCDQFEAIFSDETLVEQAKRQGPYRPRKPKMALLAEVCGRGHPLTWLLPCQSVPRGIEPIHHYSV
ncbi:hypothetical protein TCAL_01698 [Tigriopus californicus]|uniref:Uncharacterized protein n=1 Tax=Tigriopus californicus TaxID=6832 RepID=A0A553PL18_TIGCA|nr:hypothetical protein TCAL_01698 [Tigriopus californicus]